MSASEGQMVVDLESEFASAARSLADMVGSLGMSGNERISTVAVTISDMLGGQRSGVA